MPTFRTESSRSQHKADLLSKNALLLKKRLYTPQFTSECNVHAFKQCPRINTTLSLAQELQGLFPLRGR